MRDFGLDDVTGLDGGEVVGRQPLGDIGLTVGIYLTGLERLEDRLRVGVVVVADLVEVPHALVEGQILAPPVGVALVSDLDAEFGACKGVWAGADGNLHRGFGEILALPLGLLQDRAQAKDQRQFAVFGVEGEADRAFAGLLHRRDLLPRGGVARVAVGAEFFHRPHHVIDRDRAAVRESGLGPQGEFGVGAGVVGIYRFGQQPVKREGFVIIPAHQRLDREGRNAKCCAPLGHEGVETVVTARLAPAVGAALWGIGVHLRQGHKIRGESGVAIHSYAVRRFRLRACGIERQQCRQPEPAQTGPQFPVHPPTLPYPAVVWADSKGEIESIQTFSLAIGGERTIKTLLLDRFLACMKPASKT